MPGSRLPKMDPKSWLTLSQVFSSASRFFSSSSAMTCRSLNAQPGALHLSLAEALDAENGAAALDWLQAQALTFSIFALSLFTMRFFSVSVAYSASAFSNMFSTCKGHSVEWAPQWDPPHEFRRFAGGIFVTQEPKTKVHWHSADVQWAKARLHGAFISRI